MNDVAGPADRGPDDLGPADRTRRFRLDRSCRRAGDGRLLIGGSPLRVLTLAGAGVSLIDDVERTGRVGPTSGAAARLLERLVDLGVVHPEPERAVDADEWASAITVVVPCRDELPRHPRWTCASVVVDDASEPPLEASDRTVVRLDRNAGPGGARNAGLATVDTPLVAFVDADVEVDEASLMSLAAWFDDPRVAAVAPRIRALDGPGALAAFEEVRSPLDLGDEPARVAATTRVSYVPAAVLLCRVSALRDVGGFDADLRYGEDVDLVWRLAAAGWRVRYDPAVVAGHRTRPTLRAWVEQRFRYGTSAAPLARRHPGALAPLRMSGWSAATWIPVALGLPVVGAAVGVATSLALVRKLPQVPPRESLRLAASGNLYAGRLWCSTLRRAWWPASLVAALASRRGRRIVAVAWLVPLVADAQRPSGGRRRIGRLRAAALGLVDDLAYGAGVWVGAWRERSADALLPSFESWPPRGGPEPTIDGTRPRRPGG